MDELLLSYREMKKNFFKRIEKNDINCSNVLEKTVVFTVKWTISWNKLKKTIVFFTEQAVFTNNFWKHDSLFTERPILLNEQYYWTIVYWENKIDGKRTIILRTNEMGSSRTMNSNKISKYNIIKLGLSTLKHFLFRSLTVTKINRTTNVLLK